MAGKQRPLETIRSGIRYDSGYLNRGSRQGFSGSSHELRNSSAFSYFSMEHVLENLPGVTPEFEKAASMQLPDRHHDRLGVHLQTEVAHRATIEASSPQDTYGDSLGGRGLQPIA